MSTDEAETLTELFDRLSVPSFIRDEMRRSINAKCALAWDEGYSRGVGDELGGVARMPTGDRPPDPWRPHQLCCEVAAAPRQEAALSEFLLARIEEDEALVGSIDTPVEDGINGLAWDLGALDGGAARVAAECEVKRQVLNALSGLPFENAILRRLALAYVSHPDYQQEWRP